MNAFLTKHPLGVTKHLSRWTKRKTLPQNHSNHCIYVGKSIILWRMRRWIFILLSGWLTVICTWAGDSIVSQLSCRRFTTLDGLPQMQAETVFQDSEGYIWIGTLSGFVRYDGRSLTPFLKGRRENIVQITETSEGVSALGFRRQWLVDGPDSIGCSTISMPPTCPKASSSWKMSRRPTAHSQG